MIPLLFTDPIPELVSVMPARLAELGEEGVVVKRVTPKERPARFVLLVGDGGPRTREVHRLYRVRAQVWATHANKQTDWDGVCELAKHVQYVLERFARTSTSIATVTDSTGPDAVQDPSGVEYRFLSVEYQLRGIPAP
ncbi:hypothetical protein [Microbacterium sp. LMI1x-1-1.1]|uniref:hypothetical protein n=1 Tax=Microbacterium sp. LMI1x-1-1.1 TaxID=3135246 RepID=UPI00343E6A86